MLQSQRHLLHLLREISVDYRKIMDTSKEELKDSLEFVCIYATFQCLYGYGIVVVFIERALNSNSWYFKSFKWYSKACRENCFSYLLLITLCIYIIACLIVQMLIYIGIENCILSIDIFCAERCQYLLRVFPQVLRWRLQLMFPRCVIDWLTVFLLSIQKLKHSLRSELCMFVIVLK